MEREKKNVIKIYAINNAEYNAVSTLIILLKWSVFHSAISLFDELIHAFFFLTFIFLNKEYEE